MIGMVTCHLQLKAESKTEYRFLIYRLFVKIKHLPLLSTGKLPLVEFIHMLTDFYYLPISFALFTHSLTDACKFAQVVVNYTVNELV